MANGNAVLMTSGLATLRPLAAAALAAAGLLVSGCGLIGNEGETQAAVVKGICLDCHNAAEQVGGLNLEALPFDQIPAHAETWEKVVRKLRAGLMPPADGGPTRIGFELSEPATALRLELIDKSGKVVHAKTLTNVAPGMQTFEWSGRSDGGGAVPAGALGLRVAAFDGNVPVQAIPLVPTRVVGITQSNGAARLELDAAEPVAPSEVRLIL